MDRTPKNREYFDRIEEIGDISNRSALVFCSSKSPDDKKAMLTELEHRGDEAVQRVRDMLDEHKDPPLRDNQDIYQLVNNIDNVIDSLKKAAGRIVLYKLEYDPPFVLMGELVLEATEKIKQALPLLRSIGKNHQKIREFCVKVASIESRGDQQEEDSIRSVLSLPHPGLFIEVIGLLEHALNQCEDVSQFVDTLKKKNA